ncbi:MAG: sulfurtransferase-like selenium metabolism protein YedF [Tissierellia bacterium]|nr:sulfurtransferase-like selenium metabolism protein YedF [Tissierellia bacterium]
MRKEIDARGLQCPQPVILTKKELDTITEGVLTTLVDNEVAKENVSKLVQGLGFEYKVDEREGYYQITIFKGDGQLEVKEEEDNFEDLTIAFTSNTMGKGNDELGKILMKSFIYTVSETEPLPKTMVFYNGGVRLTCQGSEVLDDLKKLEAAGVEIISCGTCLDFLKLKEDLRVGSISNMYTIYEKLKDPKKNIIVG